MGASAAEKIRYEDLRNARISENQARLASLGLEKSLSELRAIISPPKPPPRKWEKKVYDYSSLRRSNRLKAEIQVSDCIVSLRRSDRLRRKDGDSDSSLEGDLEQIRRNLVAKKRKKSAIVPLVKEDDLKERLSPEFSARRCSSKGRGSLYDPVYGICCHFCRQKKLCGEEDCRRCGELDMDQPCKGKTDCSVCHSSNGVLCRACLKVRYGEEMEKVRKNKEWICPHCSEEKGINPYWICNSSLCLKKRKMVPTGIAIFRAREMGYKSVAHLLMDELQRKVGSRR
ncbi:hypothetical protein Sjap_018387 [Stephania japonica]|uniref:Zinc-finger domain-containing protein n=1 Tax=Stephania japonica TaxID=461633 RepID=A0AAP0I7W6_9MAGN